MSIIAKIGDWSLFCHLLSKITKASYNRYYKKISVVNKEKLEVEGPIIFAPNHQGTLMDALALIFGLNKQFMFLARADIFKKPIVKNILYLMKILPAYRSRDGIDSLQKNEEIFGLTIRALKKKVVPLCIFPEGSHGNKRRLRPLVKGMFRIAFKTQEEYGLKPGVKIIPVGIDYGHYQKFRNTQLIVVGDPIEVCEYWQEYAENPAVAMNSLRDRLSEEMRKVMIDIETEEYYDLYMGLRTIFNKQMRKRLNLNNSSLYNKFKADKKMITALDQCLKSNRFKIEEINQLYTEYSGLRDHLNLRDWVPEKPEYSIIRNIAGMLISMIVLPLFLLGLFNNWPHFFLPPRKFKNIKDPQFMSTAKWGMGHVLFPMYFIPLSILALIFVPFWWLKWLYIITFIPSGIFALSYRNFIVKSMARIRYTFNMRRKDKETTRMRELHEKIIFLTDQVIEKNS